jgi:ABC-type amino acid transport system permease subunit
MEIVRGGIEAVPREQFQAALSLGFSNVGAMTTVVLPQAMRSMTPSLVNQAVFMVKATSVVSLFGVTEFLYVAKEQIERTLMGFEIMAFVWVAYTLVCYPLTALGRWFEARLKARGQTALASASL